MKGKDGRILVEGFYDDVKELSTAERAGFARVQFDAEAFRKQVGVPALFGEPEFSPTERMWARPTLDIVGMWGGFQGKGSKTIIPARGYAKVSCRLVPDQDPTKISELLVKHVKTHTPVGVIAKATPFPGRSKAYQIPVEHPSVGALARVLKRMYGREAAVIRLGGTLPIAQSFVEILGNYMLYFAVFAPDENVHSPNEFLRLEEFDMLRSGLPLLLTELKGVL